MGKNMFIRSNRRVSLCVSALILLVSSISSYAQGTSESVTVTTPGTLMELVSNLETSRIYSLKIEGSLNTEDLSYIGQNSGKMSQVKELDLTGISLIAGDEPYKTYQLKEDPLSLLGSNTAICYISDTTRIEVEMIDAPLGGLIIKNRIYGKDLAGLFAGTSYQKVVLPEGQKSVGYAGFYDMEKLTDVVFSSTITDIGDYAFAWNQGLTRLELPHNIEKIGNCSFYNSCLEELSFSENLRSIGNYAFQATKIKTVDLSHVEEIGVAAFSECKLTGILDLSSLSIVEEESFQCNSIKDIGRGDCITGLILSPNLKVIGNRAFAVGIESLDLPEGLETIGDYAFDGCGNLKDISFPSSLTSIGYNAFNLTAWDYAQTGDDGVVYVGNLAYAFDDKSLVDSELLSFKEGTTTICANFHVDAEDGDKIKKIILPSSLKRIESGTDGSAVGPFGGLSGLEELVVNEGLEYIGEKAFRGCKNMWIEKFPSSIRHIGNYAFSGCDGLTEITLSEGLEYLGSWAFEDCKGLYSIKYNCNLEDDSRSSFSGCEGLYQILIGKDVKYIPEGMFGYSGVYKVSFEDSDSRPEKLSLGAGCFSDCKNLTDITLPPVHSLGNGCFYDSGLNHLTVDGDCDVFEGGWMNLCKNLETVKISGRISKIEDSVFSGCALQSFEALSCDSIGNISFRGSNIQNFVVSEGGTVIGKEAFYYCKSLEKITLNDNSELGEGSFKYSGLQEVNLGSGILNIPDNAFYDCSSLRSFNSQSKIDKVGVGAFTQTCISKFDFENIKSIGGSAFGGVYFSDMAQLYLPDGFNDLGAGAFSNTNLSDVSLPVSLLSIPEQAFKDSGRFHLEWRIPDGYEYEGNTYNVIDKAAFASALTNSEIVVPEGVHEIMNLAFYNNNLKTIVLPSTLKSIFANSLQKGEGGTVETIYCYAQTPPSVDVYGLLDKWVDDIFDCVIYVPASCLSVYKEDYFWGKYDIRPISVEVESISLDEESLVLVPGESYQLAANIEPMEATDKSLVWTSSDESVATVSSNGLVAAVHEGTAIISVSASNGVSATCVVTVETKIVEMEAIILDAEDLALEVGDCYQLSATVVPVDATYTELEWWTENENVAVVDNYGLVTVTGVGETLIRVRSAVWNDVEATCRINASSDVAGIICEDQPCDIYSISGELLREGVAASEIGHLRKGMYIICQGSIRKKVVKR